MESGFSSQAMTSGAIQYGVPMKVFLLPTVRSNCALTPKSTRERVRKQESIRVCNTLLDTFCFQSLTKPVAQLKCLYSPVLIPCFSYNPTHSSTSTTLSLRLWWVKIFLSWCQAYINELRCFALVVKRCSLIRQDIG